MHLGAQGMRMLPKDILDTLAFRAEKNNLPPIGSPLNKGFWTSAQINIAPAVAFCSGGGALADALGQAGQSHTDDNDEPANWTCMVSLSDAPTCHDGVVAWMELGFFAVLRNNRPVYFRGRRLHGGTAPHAPEGVPVPRSLVRMTAIMYLNQAIMRREGSWTVAFDKEHIVETPPLGRPVPEPTLDTRRSMIEFGGDLMTLPSYFNWQAREWFNIAYEGTRRMNRLPPGAKMTINPAIFLSAFKYSIQTTQADGTTSSVEYDMDEWEHPPGKPSLVEEKRLEEFVKTMTVMTPACVANARTLQILLFPLSISYLIVRHNQEEEGACARGGETLQEVETT